MKKLGLRALCLASVVFSLPAFSQYTAGTGTVSTEDDTLTTYVKNLGDYLGYDLEKDVTPVEAMLSYTFSLAKTGQQILNVFFAAIPVNSAYDEFTSGAANYDTFNAQANVLFTDFNSPGSADVSVVKNFDQQSYQQDPVSQAILNILATPNTTNCVDSDDATCISQNKVMNTVIQDVTDKNGYLPGETTYFSDENNAKFLSQLNVNTLISPLIYTTGGDKTSTGLPAANQQQQAMDFIRYATSAVLPFDTMQQSDYSTLWNQAKQSTDGQDQTTIDSIHDAQKNLMTYLLNLRVYAAQSSVAVSNLFDIMAKRMPQSTGNTTSGTATVTSQAFNEFQMATWRMYNPQTKSDSDQWVEQINAASSATIQKEIAILLSEINYQLYLNRQLEERNILTNSLALLQLMVNNRPTTTAVSSNDTTATTTS